MKQFLNFIKHWFLVLIGARMTVKQIVQDTLAFYTSNPRSMNDNNEFCLYNGENGTQCAFRRYVQDNSAHLLEEFHSAYTFLRENTDILKPEVQWITDGMFWNKLQALHDSSHGNKYWNEESPQAKFRVLTIEGAKAYKELLNYKLNLR